MCNNKNCGHTTGQAKQHERSLAMRAALHVVGREPRPVINAPVVSLTHAEQLHKTKLAALRMADALADAAQVAVWMGETPGADKALWQAHFDKLMKPLQAWRDGV